MSNPNPNKSTPEYAAKHVLQHYYQAFHSSIMHIPKQAVLLIFIFFLSS
jgi:hypothetical protein